VARTSREEGTQMTISTEIHVVATRRLDGCLLRLPKLSLRHSYGSIA
jgi:hypothetical protein